MSRLSPFTLIVTFVCLALVGLALVPMLPVKLNPSRTLPGFTVRFSMPGTSSRVVEMEATSKLESMLARIKGVKAMYSTSGNGYGSITVDLDKHADVDAVRFEASTIIRQTWSQLPSGVSYPYIDMKVPDENASRPFLSFTLNAPSTPTKFCIVVAALCSTITARHNHKLFDSTAFYSFYNFICQSQNLCMGKSADDFTGFDFTRSDTFFLHAQ